MGWIFKSKKELDNKSIQISVMYLYQIKTKLENELKAGKRKGESEKFTAEHDIRCLENTIAHLESNPQ